MATKTLKSRLWYPWATKQRRRRTGVAYLFMAPSLIVLGVFMFYPLARAGWLSLTNYSFFGASHFIGLSNYRHPPHYKARHLRHPTQGCRGCRDIPVSQMYRSLV